MGPQAHNFLSVTHVKHAGVQQLTKGPQLHVDTTAMSMTVPVDILPLPLTNWVDHRPILPPPSRWR
jgi:hypothetical protein